MARIVYSAENWDDFSGTTETGTGDSTDKSKDRVTKQVYDGLGNVTQQVCMDPNGDGVLTDNQITRYLFESPVSAVLITSEISPDSSDTTSSGSDQIKRYYTIDSKLSQQIDQHGTVLDFSYTNTNKPEVISVSTLGSGVDGSIRSVKRTYDDLSRLQKVTSYSGVNGSGTVVNEIEEEYDDFGEVAKEYQSHAGSVNTTTSLSIQYGYDTSVTSNVFANGRRLQSLTYPDGKMFFYDYDVSSGSPYHKLSLIRKIRESSSSGTELAIYDYTGSGKMAIADLPEPDLKLDYFQGSSGSYAGWDRFGRIKEQFWDGYGSTSDVDRFAYAYDYSSNRTSRDIDGSIYSSDDRDQAYTYDNLQRLKKSQEGTLSGGAISGTPAKEEDWTLDALGNWSGYLTKSAGTTDLDQSRSVNYANEVTNITETTGTVWVNPAYDGAGNMTSIPKPSDLTGAFTASYDAWSRLVSIKDGANTIVEYAYDGENRQILKSVYVGGSLDHTDHTYYSHSGQVLEVRREVSFVQDVDPLEQFVWHPFYIDAPLLRSYDAFTVGAPVRYYFTFDGNFNVTGVTDNSGSVLERYHYSSYGQLTVLDDDFSVDSDGISDVDNSIMYAGRRLDIESGFYYYRSRFYHSLLGMFINRDPVGSSGGMNLYSYVGSSPLNYLDPTGESPAPSSASGNCQPVCSTESIDLPEVRIPWVWPTGLLLGPAAISSGELSLTDGRATHRLCHICCGDGGTGFTLAALVSGTVSLTYAEDTGIKFWRFRSLKFRAGFVASAQAPFEGSARFNSCTDRFPPGVTFACSTVRLSVAVDARLEATSPRFRLFNVGARFRAAAEVDIDLCATLDPIGGGIQLANTRNFRLVSGYVGIWTHYEVRGLVRPNDRLICLIGNCPRQPPPQQ